MKDTLLKASAHHIRQRRWRANLRIDESKCKRDPPLRNRLVRFLSPRRIAVLRAALYPVSGDVDLATSLVSQHQDYRRDPEEECGDFNDEADDLVGVAAGREGIVAELDEYCVADDEEGYQRCDDCENKLIAVFEMLGWVINLQVRWRRLRYPTSHGGRLTSR